MDRADPRAGQHRIGGLGDHRQVEDDAVAFPHAQLLQDVGHAADLGVQLLVGDVLGGFFGSSGSKMIAVWSPRVARWRSMQLAATFSVPSSNHLISTLPGAKEVFLTLV
jgi:hypothetical protein